MSCILGSKNLLYKVSMNASQLSQEGEFFIAINYNLFIQVGLSLVLVLFALALNGNAHN